MPIYEYRCDDCDRVFERLQRISDAPLAACSVCGVDARRLVSSPAIQFLGSGWYVTDYARKNSNGANGAPSKTESAAKDGSSSKAGSSEKSDSSSVAGKERSGARQASTGGARASSGSESRTG